MKLTNTGKLTGVYYVILGKDIRNLTQVSRKDDDLSAPVP